ncbi:MAG TPA: M23 family metallopeptidase, partial [Candidatus Saccharimonadales bacterium]|nr:M23 family metallopeptidase [Candidatus Saccharimonadales bacterium]
AGTPFYAAVGGVVKVLEYNVKDEQFCKDAFNNIGASMDIIKDPIQKEVRITRTIGNDTYEVIYAHMSQIDVKDGQIVKGNEQIGKTGNSGCSTGDHAHFEIRVNGVSINPNVLFIHGKIQPMGAIKSSSTDKREGQAKSTQDHATEEEHLYVHSSAESDAKHAKVVESDEQLPDRRKKIDAIKRLAALKSQMSQSHESQQLPVEGYLSVR